MVYKQTTGWSLISWRVGPLRFPHGVSPRWSVGDLSNLGPMVWELHPTWCHERAWYCHLGERGRAATKKVIVYFKRHGRKMPKKVFEPLKLKNGRTESQVSIGFFSIQFQSEAQCFNIQKKTQKKTYWRVYSSHLTSTFTLFKAELWRARHQGGDQSSEADQHQHSESQEGTFTTHRWCIHR